MTSALSKKGNACRALFGHALFCWYRFRNQRDWLRLYAGFKGRREDSRSLAWATKTLLQDSHSSVVRQTHLASNCVWMGGLQAIHQHERQQPARATPVSGKVSPSCPFTCIPYQLQVHALPDSVLLNSQANVYLNMFRDMAASSTAYACRCCVLIVAGNNHVAGIAGSS